MVPSESIVIDGITHLSFCILKDNEIAFAYSHLAVSIPIKNISKIINWKAFRTVFSVSFTSRTHQTMTTIKILTVFWIEGALTRKTNSRLDEFCFVFGDFSHILKLGVKVTTMASEQP